MTIACRLVEAPSHEPGDMWYAPWMLDPENAQHDYYVNEFLSDEYKRDWLGKRAPICICLPNGAGVFCLDQHSFNDKGEAGAGWTVTGEPPNLTVKPSIDAVGYWHGFLTGGVLTP